MINWKLTRLSPFFHLTTITLVAGLLHGFGYDHAGSVFYISLVLLGPITLHIHLTWLEDALPRWQQTLIAILYLMAGVLVLPFIFWSIAALQANDWFMTLRNLARAFASLALLLTIFLLARRYQNSRSARLRAQIRLMLFGVLTGLLPILFLSLIPEVLGRPFLHYNNTFPFLLLIPLFDVYQFYRIRLVRFERILTRLSFFYLVTFLLFTGYLIFESLFAVFHVSSQDFWLWHIFFLTVILVILTSPLNEIVQNWVGWFFYGSERTSMDLLSRAADSLALITDQENLRCTLVDELTSLMPVGDSTLFLGNEKQGLALIGVRSTSRPSEVPQAISRAENWALLQQLKSSRDLLTVQEVQSAFQSLTGPTAAFFNNLPGTSLLLPLISADQVQGLWVLSPQTDTGYFNAEERRVLSILARQAGIAAHNVLLMEAVQAGREELAFAHQKLLSAREQERLELARELHDNAVQQLLAISYLIADTQREIHTNEACNPPLKNSVLRLNDVRQEIYGVVSELRTTIGDLRPPGLDEFGLSLALEEYIRKITRQETAAVPEIVLHLEEEFPRLAEPIETGLFRVAQEAVRNALRHASARQLQVDLYQENNTQGILLKVSDNGCGFTIPERLGEMAHLNHFGLIGIAERVDSMGGQFKIRSTLGHGTRIEVWVPCQLPQS